MTRTAEFGLVDMLAACATRSQCVDPEVGIIDRDIDLGDFGQNRDRSCGGMDAACGLGVGNALNAVNTGFELELGEGTAATDLGNDLLEPAHGAFAGGDHIHLPSLLGCVAFVHPKQIAGEKRGLVASGAGANLDDDIAGVHRILGQQRQLELLFQHGAPAFERAASRLPPSTAVGHPSPDRQ